MKYCLYVNNRILTIVVSVLSAIVLSYVAFYLIHNAGSPLILFFTVPLSLFVLGVAGFSIGNLILDFRKYKFTSEGLWVQSMNFKPHFFPWSSIKEIGICKVHYTSRAPYKFRKVFRCVLKDETNGPKQGYGIWASELYHIFHMRTVVVIDHSFLLQKQLEDNCPFPLSNYLNIRKNAYDT